MLPFKATGKALAVGWRHCTAVVLRNWTLAPRADSRMLPLWNMQASWWEAIGPAGAASNPCVMGGLQMLPEQIQMSQSKHKSMDPRACDLLIWRAFQSVQHVT